MTEALKNLAPTVLNEFYFHPTPVELVDSFVRAMSVEMQAVEPSFDEAPLRILDMFCGDGRLGKAAAKLLKLKQLGPSLTLADIVMRTNGVAELNCEEKTLDCFLEKWTPTYHVVVANPPFKAIGRVEAEKMTLGWESVADSGRNLYSLGIQKCLDACADGGLVAVIAPFSWTTGVTFRRFRGRLAQACKRVHVVPYPGKAHFDDVHQEIAFQFFWKRNAGEPSPELATVLIGSVSLPLSIDQKNPRGISTDVFQVRVGPLVWNRTDYLLVKHRPPKTTLIVYGGNIFVGAPLLLNHGRYESRQAIGGRPDSEKELFRGPGILLRRTVRGRPGGWVVDAVAVSRQFSALLENHVIWIQVPKLWTLADANSFCELLTAAIGDAHGPSGSATLNLEEVKQGIYNVTMSAEFGSLASKPTAVKRISNRRPLRGNNGP